MGNLEEVRAESEESERGIPPGIPRIPRGRASTRRIPSPDSTRFLREILIKCGDSYGGARAPRARYFFCARSHLSMSVTD